MSSDSFEGLPVDCTSPVCFKGMWKAEGRLFKSQSVREGWGSCSGNSNQQPGRSRQHITPGHQKSGDSEPICLDAIAAAWYPIWKPDFISGGMAESTLSICLSAPKQHREHRQLARGSGERPCKEQTQHSRRPAWIEGSGVGLAPSSCRKGKVFINQMCRRRERLQAGWCSAWNYWGKAWFLLTSCWLFYLGRMTLPPLNSICWAMETEGKKTIATNPELSWASPAMFVTLVNL